jgi:hypothetical protein
MLLIAHRGFAEGEHENTLEAFTRAAADPRIAGVEVDIRWSPDRSDVVLRHDPFTDGSEPAAPTLDEALAFAAARRWQVLIECKEYDDALFARVRTLADKHAVADRVVLFGFKDVAEKFTWRGTRPFRLGVIEEYPWRIAETVRRLKPDVVLMGWSGGWTRRIVKSYWFVRSLARLAARHPGTQFVMGVAQSEADIAWLRRRNALHAATVDFTAP